MKKSPVDEFQSHFNSYEERLKLINEHLERVEEGINKALKKINDRPPQILQEIIDKLQLEPKPINGKYRPSSGDYKQFVNWIVDNRYDDYLSEKNFFTFIHCTIEKESINRYFREARTD